MSILANLKKFSLNHWIFTIFIILYVLNVTQLIFVYKNSVVLERLVQEEFSTVDQNIIQQQLESNDNIDVYLKNRLYQKTSEIVLDTSQLENKLQTPVKNQYVNYFNKENIPNWLIWYKCYFGEYKNTKQCY
jgi:hypothetical protein